VKALGSAANYIEDEQKYAAPEKLKMIKQQAPRESKDKAKIKYNYKDFIS
jgi:hypothetical protein